MGWFDWLRVNLKGGREDQMYEWSTGFGQLQKSLLLLAVKAVLCVRVAVCPVFGPQPYLAPIKGPYLLFI